MTKKFILVLVLMVIFSMLAVNFGLAAEPAPLQPNGQSPGGKTPPSAPNALNMANGTQPLKQVLEVFYNDKENYINQKRMCKENSMRTNAPQGTCWEKLKPMMLGLLKKEIMMIEKRLIQLENKNITMSNPVELDAKLAAAKAVFENPDSTKAEIKAAAKSVEEVINQVEEEALKDQPEVLIKQMDNLMTKADSITLRLDSMLAKLKSSGYNTAELETSLNEYKADLAKAKENVASAKAKFATTKSNEEISVMAKEVRQFINDAQSSLVKAFDKAKAMMLGVNNANKGGASGAGNNTNSNSTNSNGGKQ